MTPGQLREMAVQAKDAAEITHGDQRADFLFELDEFQMREFLFIYRKEYRGSIQNATIRLNKTLRQECLDTKLLTVEQWNSEIAPSLVALDQAIESPKDWSLRVLTPLTPWEEFMRKLQLFAQTHGHWLPATAEQELRQLANLQPPEPPKHADKFGRTA